MTSSGSNLVRLDLFGLAPGVLLTEQELAAAMNYSRKTLQYWRQSGQGPPFIRLGRQVRYRVGEVVKWLEHSDA
ncbi:hypothetical protein L332_04905 [Agrococcus pavilionensis RW1]|uniref:Helix-turn-helix domain-containing protein n=2 Tax=Agrococcus TaxID=46352 RepID=U1LP93_9MICO|nr:hypothetical protein L332_04905 [Agrococcus pavilionensis RW1]